MFKKEKSGNRKTCRVLEWSTRSRRKTMPLWYEKFFHPTYLVQDHSLHHRKLPYYLLFSTSSVFTGSWKLQITGIQEMLFINLSSPYSLLPPLLVTDLLADCFQSAGACVLKLNVEIVRKGNLSVTSRIKSLLFNTFLIPISSLLKCTQTFVKLNIFSLGWHIAKPTADINYFYVTI